VHGEEAPSHFSRYAGEVARGLAAADLVVAPTASMLAMLEHHYGPLRHTQVIHNGRRDSGIVAAKEPFVLTAGRLWDEAKNAAAVAAVAPRLSWPVYVAGDRRSPDGRDEAQLQDVEALGVLPALELADWMARASIFALPARYEPFGLSALEAALAGCALVLGDIRSLREVWADTAVYVPPGNRAALASALRALIADRDRRARLAQRAQARARRMTPEAMAATYMRAYVGVHAAHRPEIAAV
jgi:glycosyltransferase involved in cell wall biosynthesis